MSFVNSQSFEPLFSETKGKQNLWGLKICVVKGGWSDLKSKVLGYKGGILITLLPIIQVL